MDKLIFIVFAFVGDVKTEVAQFQIVPNHPTEVIFVETKSRGGYLFKRYWLADKKSEQAIIDAPCEEGEEDPRMHCSRAVHYYEKAYEDSLIKSIVSRNNPLLSYSVKEIKYEGSRFYVLPNT